MDTTLAHADGDPFSRHGAVNPPVYRASTILYPTVGEYEAARDPARRFDVVRYGQLGTPTTFALEQAVAAIEGGYRAMLLPSGLAAVTATLQALLSSGRLKIAAELPLAEVLKRELLHFKVKITVAGNETFEAWRERDHDDLVLALALALYVGSFPPVYWAVF